MTQEHADQLHRQLSKVPHLYDIRRVATFKAYWRDDDEITIHIEDLGPDAPQDQRYRCIAKPTDAKSGETRIAASNPTSDPVMAVISMLPHWKKLDRVALMPMVASTEDLSCRRFEWGSRQRNPRAEHSRTTPDQVVRSQ